MKGAIRRHCNEGHNILIAFDMHEALKARQVKGSSSAVCELDRGMKELKVNRINNFSAFHNFSYDNEGLLLAKVYGVGSERLIPWGGLSRFPFQIYFQFSFSGPFSTSSIAAGAQWVWCVMWLNFK